MQSEPLKISQVMVLGRKLWWWELDRAGSVSCPMGTLVLEYWTFRFLY